LVFVIHNAAVGDMFIEVARTFGIAEVVAQAQGMPQLVDDCGSDRRPVSAVWSVCQGMRHVIIDCFQFFPVGEVVDDERILRKSPLHSVVVYSHSEKFRFLK